MNRASTIRVAVLWCAFLLVHLLTAWLGWVYPSQPMGDVVLVYEPWASSTLGGGPIVGITETWVYPQVALVPMLIAAALAAPSCRFSAFRVPTWWGGPRW